MSAKKPKKAAATAEERALAERAVGEQNDFVTRGVPLADKFRELTADPTAGRRLAGQANAQVAEAFAGAEQRGLEGVLGAGGGIGSGAALSALSLPGLKMASARGVGTGQALQMAEDRGLKGLMKLSAFGRGIADTSSVGLRSAAQDSTQAAIDAAQRNTQNYISKLDALNTAVGYAGGQYLNKVGQGIEAKRKDNPKYKAGLSDLNIWK